MEKKFIKQQKMSAMIAIIFGTLISIAAIIGIAFAIDADPSQTISRFSRDTVFAIHMGMALLFGIIILFGAKLIITGAEDLHDANFELQLLKDKEEEKG